MADQFLNKTFLERWCIYFSIQILKNLTPHTHTIIKLCCYVIRSVSHNYTVLFLSHDVKNTKFNQYLPVDLKSLNVSKSRFRKPVMFWRWHHHGVALWRHGRGAGHNCLLLMTASNVNCWADVANHMTRLWQAGDMKNFESRITG